jgi:hypothetical protein
MAASGKVDKAIRITRDAHTPAAGSGGVVILMCLCMRGQDNTKARVLSEPSLFASGLAIRPLRFSQRFHCAVRSFASRGLKHVLTLRHSRHDAYEGKPQSAERSNPVTPVFCFYSHIGSIPPFR